MWLFRWCCVRLFDKSTQTDFVDEEGEAVKGTREEKTALVTNPLQTAKAPEAPKEAQKADGWEIC